MELHTNRLLITKLTMDMSYDIFINSNDEDNKRFVPDEVFETEADAKEVIQYLMNQYEDMKGPLLYPIIVKDDNKNIGYVQIVPLNDDEWEVGYHIAKSYTGNGYATEALKAFIPKAMDMLKITEVFGVVLKENKASSRVLEKSGFIKVFDGIDEYQGVKREVMKYKYSR